MFFSPFVCLPAGQDLRAVLNFLFRFLIACSGLFLLVALSPVSDATATKRLLTPPPKLSI
jgi:hypothetical protein